LEKEWEKKEIRERKATFDKPDEDEEEEDLFDYIDDVEEKNEIDEEGSYLISFIYLFF
jgi:hypothetical protein